MLRVEDVIQECWMPSGNCVVSQLSAHLEIPATVLEEHLDTLHIGWREEGVMPKDVVALAKLLHRSCYLLGENRLLLKHEVATRRTAICCMVALGHFHLYRNCKFAKMMIATAQEKPMPHQVFLKDAAPRKVHTSKWKPWEGEFEAGEYCFFNIDDARE